MYLGPGQAHIEYFGEDLKITIPSEKNLRFPLFMIVWFFVWYLGYVLASEQTSLFLKFWVQMWKVVTVFMIFLVLWFFFGYEKIYIAKSDITFSMSLLGIVFYKKILEHEFVRCKYNQEGIERQNARKNTVFLLTAGKIRIEYPYSHYAFGSGLTEADALRLIDTINDKIIN